MANYSLNKIHRVAVDIINRMADENMNLIETEETLKIVRHCLQSHAKASRITDISPKDYIDEFFND